MNLDRGTTAEAVACSAILRDADALAFARSLNIDVHLLFEDSMYGDIAAACVRGIPLAVDPNIPPESAEAHFIALECHSYGGVDSVRQLARECGSEVLMATLKTAADQLATGGSIEHWRREVNKMFYITTGEE